jgi:hypothetical protein
VRRLRRRRLLDLTGRLARERALWRSRLRHRPVRHCVGTAAIRVCGRLPSHSIHWLRRLGLSVRLILPACVRRSRLSRLLLAIGSAITAGGGVPGAVRRLPAGLARVAWAGRASAAALASAERKAARQASQDDQRTDPAGKSTHTNEDALGQMRFASALRNPSSRCFGSMIQSCPVPPVHRTGLPSPL